MTGSKIMPEKMDLESMDIAAENRIKLKQLFPTVFSESVNNKGDLVESIFFEKLKAELGTFSEIFEAGRERYGMDWPGKKECLKLIQQPSVATLKPCREESVNFDETENLFIEGDNLEVLKLLQKSYYGKVKMIYIDPPYNTGKEFIYPDKYSETLETYLAYAGLMDDEGKKFATNTAAEGRFHTKWLNMMYPRLYLARNFLREDGVIFISIDDNEVNNLRKVCDDIFGEENFLASIAWEKRYTRSNNAKLFYSLKDFILVYRKSEAIQILREERTDKSDSIYRNPDNDPRGPWTSSSYVNPATKAERPNLVYLIKNPFNGQMIEHPTHAWKYEISQHEQHVLGNRLWWGKNGDAKFPRLKNYLSEKNNGLIPIDLWHYQETGTTDEGGMDLKLLFDISIFDNPKPIRLIKRMLRLTTDSYPSGIILDFFSGSCTTAHAVLDLNQEDNGKRKFIMVQLPEPCDESSEAYKAGYKTIADIGKERIRRVIAKIKEEQEAKDQQGEGGLFEDQEEKPDLDLGFRVLKLDRSNFKIWGGPDPEATEEEIKKQLELFVDHIDPEASQEDILFELLLKSGFKPTEKVEKKELAGKTVFSIAEGLLLVCLEEEITRELIDAVAEAEPMRFICLDKGFKGNDQLKANAVQTFAARNQGRDKAEQIVFRTV